MKKSVSLLIILLFGFFPFSSSAENIYQSNINNIIITLEVENSQELKQCLPNNCEKSSHDGSYEVAQGCCKYCCKGKACGNSCISRSYKCHKPPGCACNKC